MTDRRYVGQEFEFSAIRYEKSDYRATITFNRPEVLNAINLTVLEEMGRRSKMPVGTIALPLLF